MRKRIKSELRSMGLGVVAQFKYDANTADSIFFVNTTLIPLRVRAITVRVEVAGTNGSAVTLAVKKAASGTAIASGTALHSSTADLKGAAATNQALTLSATAGVTIIPPGTAIGVDITGTMTAAVGCVSVDMVPTLGAT